MYTKQTNYIQYEKQTSINQSVCQSNGNEEMISLCAFPMWKFQFQTNQTQIFLLFLIQTFSNKHFTGNIFFYFVSGDIYMDFWLNLTFDRTMKSYIIRRLIFHLCIFALTHNFLKFHDAMTL